jgi:hypothetical protein
VKTVLDDLPGAVLQRGGPCGEPAAELGLAFQHGHREAALGEKEGRGDTRDAAADHDGTDRITDGAGQMGTGAAEASHVGAAFL